MFYVGNVPEKNINYILSTRELVTVTGTSKHSEIKSQQKTRIITLISYY